MWGNLRERLHLHHIINKPSTSQSDRSPRNKFGSLTSLRGRGEETDLDLFLAEFIGKLDNSIPGTLSDGLAEYVEIIDEMNLASLIDGDLVAGADAQTGVVVGAIVHETFACGRVCLFIEGAGNRELGGDTCMEVVMIYEMGSIDIDGGGLRARRDVRTGGGGDAVLDVGASEGIGVERFDVEYDGNDVKFEPQASAKVWGLMGMISTR